jgi:hypothetical protein
MRFCRLEILFVNDRELQNPFVRGVNAISEFPIGNTAITVGLMVRLKPFIDGSGGNNFKIPHLFGAVTLKKKL